MPHVKYLPEDAFGLPCHIRQCRLRLCSRPGQVNSVVDDSTDLPSRRLIVTDFLEEFAFSLSGLRQPGRVTSQNCRVDCGVSAPVRPLSATREPYRCFFGQETCTCRSHHSPRRLTPVGSRTCTRLLYQSLLKNCGLSLAGYAHAAVDAAGCLYGGVEVSLARPV